MAKRLTKSEKALLRYPPTPETWICTHQWMRLYEDEKRPCNAVNAGKKKRCWVCQAAKPTRPKRLWPKYLAACKKAGIEPRQGVATEAGGDTRPPVAHPGGEGAPSSTSALPAWAIKALKERNG